MQCVCDDFAVIGFDLQQIHFEANEIKIRKESI